MTFRFQEDDEVILKNDQDHAWFLPAGSRGVVFCQYATNPPSYEVTFKDVRGSAFGVVVCEDEIEPVRGARAATPVHSAVSTA